MTACYDVKIPEIVINNKQIEDTKDFRFNTNKQFNYKDAIELKTFTKYRLAFKWNKFLKRLHFRGSYSDFDLLNLNELIALEQLSVYLVKSEESNESQNVQKSKQDEAKKSEAYEEARESEEYEKSKEPEAFQVFEESEESHALDVLDENAEHKSAEDFVIEVNLPNLTVLEIGKFDWGKCIFRFTCRKLSILKCHRYLSIHLVYPDTIKRLDLIDYHKDTHLVENDEYLKTHFNFLWLLFTNKMRKVNIFGHPTLRTLVCNFDTESLIDSQIIACINPLMCPVLKKSLNSKGITQIY